MKVQLVSATYNSSVMYMRKFLGLGNIHAAAMANPDLARDVEIQHDHYDIVENSAEEIAQKILRCGADIVAFATYVWNVRAVLEISRLVKQGSPQTRILLGGPEVSYHHERIIRENEHLDWICSREGELTFPELLMHQLRTPDQAPDKVLGMVFRHRGELGAAPPREFNPNLYELPSPYLTGVLDLDPDLNSAYFETTRGCPFTCTYCDYGRNQPYYEFDMQRVREELRWFKQKGARAIFACDATFNYRRSRANEILRITVEEGFEGMFACEIFPSLIDDELVETLQHVKEAHLGIGIQTANPVAMRNIHRIWSPRRVEDKLEQLCAMDNVHVTFELIMGLPGDDLETFRQTVDWSFERQPHYVLTIPLQILSRTPLEQQVEEFSIVHSGPESGNEILSCYSFSREDVMLGRAICAWNGLLQAVAYRLWRLIDIKPSDFYDRWAQHSYFQGLFDRLEELQANEIQEDYLHSLVEVFRGFVGGLCRAQSKPDVSPMMAEFLRYLLRRRSLTRPAAFFLDAEETDCLVTDARHHLVYSTLPAALPAPNGLDVGRRLQPTGRVIQDRFDFDMEEVFVELDAERMAALAAKETRYVFFRDPLLQVGRAVRVDDFSQRFLERCDGQHSLAEISGAIRGEFAGRDADADGRSIAEVLVDCGLLRVADA